MKRLLPLAVLLLTQSGCLAPLTRRLDCTNEQLGTTNAQLADMRGELQQVRGQLVDANRRLEALEKLMKKFFEE